MPVFRLLTLLFLAAEMVAVAPGGAWPVLTVHGLACVCAWAWQHGRPADRLIHASRITFATQPIVALMFASADMPLRALVWLPPLALVILMALIAHREDRAKIRAEQAAAVASPPAPYRPAPVLSRAVAILIGAQLACDLLMLACRLWQAHLFRAAEIDHAAVARLDTVAACGSMLQVLFFIPAAICFLVWLHHTHRNLRALGSQNATMTPGQAVRGWFIPLYNFWRGYQSLRFVWIESQPGAVLPGGQPLPRRATLVGCWWALYLSNALLARLQTVRVETIDAFMDALAMWSLATLVYCGSAVLGILMVLRIERRQRETWDDLRRREPVAPPSDMLR